MEGKESLNDRKVVGVALAVILGMAALPFLQVYSTPRTSEAFSELGVLGPQMRLADYPRSVFVDQNFTLFILVINHEGRVVYYRVYVKVGDQSSVINDKNSLSVPPIASYERILVNNGTWIQPSELRITKPGANTRLVFELWIYDLTLNDFQYSGLWNQLLLNVTSVGPND